MSDSHDHLQEFTIRAANPAQAEQHARTGFVMWGRKQSWEEYWELYEKERKEARWGKDALVTWVLVRNDDPEGDIYAGCETYRRKGWVKHQGASDIEEGYVYGIASLVTPKHHLRQGFATRLLSLLHRHIAPADTLPPIPDSWGKDQPVIPLPEEVSSRLPKAIGSVLWSDIGSKFYSRCSMGAERPGWLVEDSQNTELVWKIFHPAAGSTEGFNWLFEEDLEEIGQILSDCMQEKLRKTDTSRRAYFVQDPSTPGVLSFAPVKGSWMEKTPSPLPVGIRIKSPSGKPSDDAIVLFAITCPPIGERFLITHISNLDSHQLPFVLQAFDMLATDAGHEEGWVWDLSLSSNLVHAWQQLPDREVRVGRRQEMLGHLLGVAWYGPEEEKGTLLESQMWSWC
ncbi:hypothetical protein LQV05_005402 [Cryptococcus neoformans]|nr:hypothetical protein J007_03613 [Cryptococcus neoformans var. grubii]OXC60839.1 hypothetical protein C358_03707 [Cryptococcus neoformans var. grubii MW-RSA852]UOH82693.1 hypothetical protein LQV05_005402 [Cryptococcus neoformans]